MPNLLDKSDVRNAARILAIGTKSGAWADVDYTPFADVTDSDTLLDYMGDVGNIVVKSAGVTVAELDDAHDTPDNAKSRASARRYVLASLLRNARKAHANDALDLRAYFADVDDAGTRGFIVTRVK